MFGARDTWKSADPDADQGPYRGFLIVQCEECGAIKAFCAKHETYGYKCGECGHETPLEKLRPLFMHCKCGKSASRAPAGESIEQRPEEIDEREEFGHWEGDTVYSGKGKRKTTRALLTLTERKTRKEIIIAIPNRKAETVVKALDALERKLGGRSSKALPLTTAPSLRRRRSWNALVSTSACPGLKCISATRIPLGSGAPTRTPTA